MKYVQSIRVVTRYFLVCFVAVAVFSTVAFGQSKGSYLETIMLYNFENLDEWPGH